MRDSIAQEIEGDSEICARGAATRSARNGVRPSLNHFSEVAALNATGSRFSEIRRAR